jgi:hypothetical protein
MTRGYWVTTRANAMAAVVLVCVVLLVSLRSCAGVAEGDTPVATTVVEAAERETAWTDRLPVQPQEEADFCCCTYDETENGTPELLKILNSIVQRPFFRFIRVNVHRPCPYYAVSLLCTSVHAPCSVCKCDPNDVPTALLADSDITQLADDYSDEPLVGRSAVPKQVEKWGAALFAGLVDEHEHDKDAGGEYVDLVGNPEGHTGYAGPLANRIWQGIYDDNCVFDGYDGCSESQVFYRLISGLHASVSTHIALTWNAFMPNVPHRLNCTELSRRVFDHADRVENIHLLYQFVLRAMTRAAGTFLHSKEVYRTGYSSSDEALWEELQKLFQVKLLCSRTFNETSLLGLSNSRSLIAQMRRRMRNVTTLTDCISCEKCRVWGKLQFLGLATALKIVTMPRDADIALARNEMVALINLLRQLALTVDTLRTAECTPPGTAGVTTPPAAPISSHPTDTAPSITVEPWFDDL